MSREKFEAWYAKENPLTLTLLRRSQQNPNCYEWIGTEMEWQAWQAATAEQAEQLAIAKQRVGELEKDCDIPAQNHHADRKEIADLQARLDVAGNTLKFQTATIEQYAREIERLRAGLQKMLDWIDGDTRAINRDVGIGIISFNDIYESLDKLDEIAHEALKGAAE